MLRMASLMSVYDVIMTVIIIMILQEYSCTNPDMTKNVTTPNIVVNNMVKIVTAIMYHYEVIIVS